MHGYDTDLAFVHNAGFTDLAEAAARMVLDHVDPPGLVVDLGCGGGTLLDTVHRAGFRCWGVDLSPAMVALARRRVPEARIEVGDACSAALPRCDVVTAVGEVFNYAFTPPADLARVFGRVHGTLDRGGLFLFDVATFGRAAEATRASRHGRGWRVEATAEERDGLLVRTIDTWRTIDGSERHHREVHTLRLYDAEDVLGCLAAAGFAAETIGGYDDHGFQPGWDGFLAWA